MTAPHTTADVAEINLDVPCASCGYNLRGLAGNGRCPECGASVARSLEIHLNPIAPAQILWARTVLAGLAAWLVLTPACLCVVLFMCSKVSGRELQWVNFPGPKLWGVPLALAQVARDINSSSPLGFVGMLLPLLVLLAVFLITARPTRRGGPEPMFNLRRAARWVSVLTVGGLFGVCVGIYPLDTDEAAGLVCFAVAMVELPGTIVLYHYVADIARRLELIETSVELRICGWGAGAVILSSAALLVLNVNFFAIGNTRLMLIGMWLAGAIAVGTSVVACGNLLRLAMALWPIAMVRLVRRSQ